MIYLNLNFSSLRLVATTSLCSYCNQHDKTFQQLQRSYFIMDRNQTFFVTDIKLITCPQIAILAYTNTDDRCFITQDLILLIFKFYVYKSRGSGNFSFSALFNKLVKTKNLEKGAAL